MAKKRRRRPAAQDDNKDPNPVGRPSLFNAALSAKICEMYEAGSTLDEIAENIGVSVRTLFLWRANKPEFFQALKKAQNIADKIVEESLFRTAVEGNVTAQIFWLKNRQPEQWRDKQSIETLGPDGKPVQATTVILQIPSNGKEPK